MNNVITDTPQNRHIRKHGDETILRTGYGVNREEEVDDEIDLKELFSVLMRRKGTILLIALLTFIASLVVTLMMQPIYRANTTLQVSPEDIKVLKYDVEAEGGSTNSRDFYQTQFEILKSRALAKRTMEGMGLEGVLQGNQLAKPFFAETISGLKSLFMGGNEDTTKDEFALLNESSDNLSAKSRIGEVPLENRLIANLTVAPVSNSQIIKLSYDSTDPQLAANVANSIAANYIELNLERRVNSASFAKDFLSKQLADVKSRLEESQVKLNNYAKEKGLYKTNDEKSLSLTAQKINQLNIAHSRAETTRIEAQNKYERGQSSFGNAKVLENLTVQTLKKSLVEIETKYQEQLQIYKPSYPLMVQLRRQIQKLKDEVARETSVIKQTVERSLQADYLAARGNEEKLFEELQLQKKYLVEVRDKDIGYKTLLREVDTNSSSYEGLLTRLKEVSVAGGVESNNISILDPAIVPYSKHKPNTRLNLVLGLVLGVFLGTVVAFLLEFLDDRVKTTDELERLLGLPLLGMTPSVKGDDPIIHALMTMEQPASAIAESFRSLRTNLLFASREGTPKVLTLTSAMPSEGKSSSCMNLATAFAQSNARVLVIDADLRKPTAHKRLKLDNSLGLSNFLTYQASIEDIVQETLIPGVSAVTAGPLSPNPSELLSSERLQELFDLAPDTFDIIIIDAPPVMGLADALVLANRASATVMVTAFAQSKKRQIQDAHRRLKQSHANIIGVLFTKVKTGGSYGGYNYDYEYYYSYGNDRIADKSSA